MPKPWPRTISKTLPDGVVETTADTGLYRITRHRYDERHAPDFKSLTPEKLAKLAEQLKPAPPTTAKELLAEVREQAKTVLAEKPDPVEESLARRILVEVRNIEARIKLNDAELAAVFGYELGVLHAKLAIKERIENEIRSKRNQIEAAQKDRESNRSENRRKIADIIQRRIASGQPWKERAVWNEYVQLHGRPVDWQRHEELPEWFRGAYRREREKRRALKES